MILMVRTLFMIFNLIYIAWEGENDAHKAHNGIDDNHPKSAAFRAAWWALASLATHWGHWYLMALYFCVLASQWLLLFDYTYNYFYGNDWYHLGKHTWDMEFMPNKSQRYLRLGCKVALAFVFHLLYFSMV